MPSTLKVSVKIVFDLAVSGVLAGPSALLLAEPVLHGLVDVVADPACRTGAGQRGLGGFVGCDACLDPGARPRESCLDALQGEHPVIDAGAASLGVALELLAGARPDDAMALAGRDRRRRGPVDLVGVALTLALPARRLGELEGVCLRPLADLGVLGA